MNQLITCAVPGCEKTTVKARGFCGRHHEEKLASGELPRIKDMRCVIEGCGKRIKVAGLCVTHSAEMEQSGLRYCAQCHELKARESFSLNHRTPDGLQSRCKACISIYGRQYRQANPDLILQRNRKYRESDPVKVAAYMRRKNLERDYGLTVEQFDLLLESQGGVCAICGQIATVDKGGRGWHVDHRHSDGKIRGVLCRECNWAIGHLHENIQRCLSAAHYLEKWNGS